MSALSFSNNHRRNLTTTTTWATQRQQLLMRKQYSFIETGRIKTTSNNNNNNNALNITNSKGRSILARGVSVDRSYESVRQKLHASNISLRHADSQSYLQRQQTFEHDLKFKNNGKTRESLLKNSKTSALSSSTTRLNSTRSINSDNTKFKQKGIVAWSSTSSLLKSNDNNDFGVLKKRNFGCSNDGKGKDVRKALTTTTTTSHSAVKSEASKINLSIVLPQTAKSSIDNETVFSDIDSSLDSGVDTDTTSSQVTNRTTNAKLKKQETILFQPTKPTPSTILTTTQNNANNPSINNAIYRRAQYRNSRFDATANNATPLTNATQISIPVNSAVAITTPTAQPTSATTLSVSPSLIIQRRPPLVRAMSAPVRPIDDSSKGAFAAHKRKSRRRKIITRNVSCEKSTEQDFLTTEIINGKKVLTRSRSVVATDIVTLVSLMSSEGSDSEREDSTQSTKVGNSTKSEKSPVRRAPSLRKTGKSVSFQENYPPNFQLASKEYSHMIRRGSIAPLTTRLRTNRPPTAPPVSIFLTMANNIEKLESKERDSTTDFNNRTNDIEKRTPMSEKPSNKSETSDSNSPSAADQNEDYDFPDYVRSIKERECWKLFQKMSNKGVNVSYDTILRGMLTPTEFRQIQKQREIEEAKARELAETENEGENVKPQTAIDRLSEALLKK